METRALFAMLVAGFCFGSGAMAQEPTCEGAESNKNYKFFIEYHSPDGSQTDIEFVASSGSFDVSTHYPTAIFRGEASEAEEGVVVIDYTLGTERKTPEGSMQRTSAGIRAELRVKLGSPMTIYSVGSEMVTLRIIEAQ